MCVGENMPGVGGRNGWEKIYVNKTLIREINSNED